MPLDIDPPEGERVFVNISYKGTSNAVPFVLGVTNQAIYIAGKKAFAMQDPYFIERVPISQVRQVVVRRTRAIGIMMLAALMIAFGAFVTYFMLEPIVHGQGGKVSGWPVALVVGGLILPFVARGRRTLKVVLDKRTYAWKPPMVIDSPSRQHIQELLEKIIAAFRSAGVAVMTE